MAKQQAAGGKVKEQQKNTLTQESLAQHSVIHKKKKAGLFKKKFSFSNFLSK